MCTVCLLFAETRCATIKLVCLCTAVLIHIATPFSIQGVGKKKGKADWEICATPGIQNQADERQNTPLSPLDTGDLKGSLCSGVESPEGGNVNQGAFCSSLHFSVPVVKCRQVTEAGLCERRKQRQEDVWRVEMRLQRVLDD